MGCGSKVQQFNCSMWNDDAFKSFKPFNRCAPVKSLLPTARSAVHKFNGNVFRTSVCEISIVPVVLGAEAGRLRHFFAVWSAISYRPLPANPPESRSLGDALFDGFMMAVVRSG